MQSWMARLGLRGDPAIFFVSAGLSLLFVILLVAMPQTIGAAFSVGRTWVVRTSAGSSFWA